METDAGRDVMCDVVLPWVKYILQNAFNYRIYRNFAIENYRETMSWQIYPLEQYFYGNDIPSQIPGNLKPCTSFVNKEQTWFTG